MVNVLQVLLAFVVGVLMLSLGATLTLDSFKETLKTSKRGVLIGFISQFIAMPGLTFLLALALDVDNVVGLSMIIVAASPGGSTSNLFTYYSNGDLPLSITMTAASTTLALGLMPLNVFIYGRHFTNEDIEIDYGNMVASLLLVLIPVSLGVFIRYKSELWAARLEKFGSFLGCVFILAALIVGSVGNLHIFDSSWEMYVAAAGMLLIGALFGYGLSRASRLSPRKARTVALETGIQNSTLSLAVIALTFPDDTPAEEDRLEELLVFPLLYSVFLVIESILLTLLFRYVLAPRDPPDEPTALADSASPKSSAGLTDDPSDSAAAAASPSMPLSVESADQPSSPPAADPEGVTVETVEAQSSAAASAVGV